MWLAARVYGVESFKITEWWSSKKVDRVRETVPIRSVGSLYGAGIFSYCFSTNLEDGACHEAALYPSRKSCRICGRQSDCQCLTRDCRHSKTHQSSVLISWESTTFLETVVLHAVSCVMAFPYYYCSVLCRSDQTLTLHGSCDLPWDPFQLQRKTGWSWYLPRSCSPSHNHCVFDIGIHCHLQDATAGQLTDCVSHLFDNHIYSFCHVSSLCCCVYTTDSMWCSNYFCVASFGAFFFLHPS